ncbi:MAG: pyoverdine biosynthesis protein PvcA [Legionella sp.]|nr:MAG: pyoverdine biosynthesis protein PvcA [Legionella sp.]
MNNLNQELALKILQLLFSFRRSTVEAEKHCAGIACTSCLKPHYEKLLHCVNQGLPLCLILPAFPAKSANRQKTLSIKPDRGEILGLTHLNQLCQKLHDIYSPGIELRICSDGRVFNDLVLVEDHAVDIYQRGIQQIIKELQLDYLTTFSLDEVYPEANYVQKRDLLMQDFGQSLIDLQKEMDEQPQLRYQFNGIHRFVIEDQLVLKPTFSKNRVRKEAKAAAYEVIRRSNAWSQLLSDYFPDAIRLSIHPQSCGSDKLGIQFLPATNRWATPWHNVLLKNAQGWLLVKRKEAEQLGAILVHDHYVLETC